MRKLSDINTCDLNGYPTNTKKNYSGLHGNWIYDIEVYPIKKSIYHYWEFGWKQKPLKESYDVDYYNYKLNKHKQYLIWDYNSCFIIFKIIVFEKNNNIEYCKLFLDSTDDGEFYIDFDYKFLKIIKDYFKKEYKTLTLNKIEEFIRNL
jgi:hypothetical protein